MKLTYRGVTYDYNPPKVEYGDRQEVGKYRGVDIRFRNIKKAPVMQPTLDLLYRGVAYTTNPAAVEPTVEPTVESVKTPALLSVQERARQLMMNHHKNVKRRQQAMLTRSDAQIGLPPSEASHFWNHIRGEVHPSFDASYDRSQAAMS